MSLALSHLLYMMDKGAQFEVRARLPAAPPAEGESKELEAINERRELMAKINEKGMSLRVTHIREKIISLPPPDDFEP